MSKAIFAAGCFWGVENTFRMVDGVRQTRVGYTGGHTKNPTYEDVCSNSTGHAEAVEVKFDEGSLSFVDLLRVFWELHDPTQLDRQGVDVGSQYRSAIFCTSDEQEKQARISLEEHQERIGKDKKIVTIIEKATKFYAAEDYHQQYFEKKRKQR